MQYDLYEDSRFLRSLLPTLSTFLRSLEPEGKTRSLYPNADNCLLVLKT